MVMMATRLFRNWRTWSIDEFHVVVSPTVLGKGRTMFEGVTKRFGTCKRTYPTFEAATRSRDEPAA